ncbi:hypothetical protein Tco_0934360 [Tanacetum coccineum]
MTSESSLGSSSERSLDLSSSSARPSRKRCRSPATLVPSSTPISRSIAPALAVLLPQTIADLGISEGVGAQTKDGIDMGVEVTTSDIRDDEEEFEEVVSEGDTREVVVDPLATSGISEPARGDAPYLEGTLYDISHYMSELEASKERVGLADRVRSLGRENLRVRALLCIERDRVDSLSRHMALSQEEFRQIRRDHDDT